MTDRVKERNAAFDNTKMYLKHLIAKLSYPHLNKIYATVCEELQLIRRAHKELIVGSLYQIDYFIGTEHVIEFQHLRHVNNPCVLSHVLRNRLTLPFPDLDKLSWLARVHTAVSYPAPLLVGQEDLETKAIRDVIKETRRISQLRHLIPEDGFTLKLENDFELNISSYRKLSDRWVNDQEMQKIFPALEALLQTLRYSFPQPKVVV